MKCSRDAVGRLPKQGNPQSTGTAIMRTAGKAFRKMLASITSVLSAACSTATIEQTKGISPQRAVTTGNENATNVAPSGEAFQRGDIARETMASRAVPDASKKYGKVIHFEVDAFVLQPGELPVSECDVRILSRNPSIRCNGLAIRTNEAANPIAWRSAKKRPSSLESISLGEESSIAEGRDEAAHARNRWVEFAYRMPR